MVNNSRHESSFDREMNLFVPFLGILGLGFFEGLVITTLFNVPHRFMISGIISIGMVYPNILFVERILRYIRKQPQGDSVE